jgi:Flp pilus assembly protein TadD
MHDAASDADLQIRTAVELYRQGNSAAAEERCRQTLTLAPGHRDAQVLLGLVLHFDARYSEAEEVFAALVLQEPHEPTHWINLGTARRAVKRFDEALAAYARAAELGAASAEFYRNVGLAHIDRYDFEAARAVLAHAAALAPEHADIRFRYAQSCYECQRTEEALQALEGWEELPELTAELAVNIGYLLMNLGASARAEIALQQAALDPAPDPHVTLTLVQALERSNRLEQARTLFDTLAADPRAPQLGVDLVLVEAQLAEREGQYESARRLLERALLDVRDLHRRHYQLFPLAKCLDALKHYDAAFETLLEAHRSQIAHIELTAPAAALRGVPTLAVTKFSCDAADVASWNHSGAPEVAASPIFIVAFPRSGTTLLETTLDAHPLLKSMDEQPFLQNALDEFAAPNVRYPEALGALTNAQLDRVREAYWLRVRRKVRLEPGQRLVDKNPLNILRLPVMRRLFPHARILIAIRHPCDVLLSCYMQHFRAPDFALLCSDLRTLARGYRRTFDYWYAQQQLLEANVREIRYESFVADFESQTRAISDFLQLPWDERVLAPAAHARTKGYISTPSYAQVVQPVHQRSIGRWRHYETRFAEVLPLLRPLLQRWNYEA